jgi:hypothetical protein
MIDRLRELHDLAAFERDAAYVRQVIALCPHEALLRHKFEALMREFAEWKRIRGIR